MGVHRRLPDRLCRRCPRLRERQLPGRLSERTGARRSVAAGLSADGRFLARRQRRGACRGAAGRLRFPVLAWRLPQRRDHAAPRRLVPRRTGRDPQRSTGAAGLRGRRRLLVDRRTDVPAPGAWRLLELPRAGLQRLQAPRAAVHRRGGALAGHEREPDGLRTLVLRLWRRPDLHRRRSDRSPGRAERDRIGVPRAGARRHHLRAGDREVREPRPAGRAGDRRWRRLGDRQQRDPLQPRHRGAHAHRHGAARQLRPSQRPDRRRRAGEPDPRRRQRDLVQRDRRLQTPSGRRATRSSC